MVTFAFCRKQPHRIIDRCAKPFTKASAVLVAPRNMPNVDMLLPSSFVRDGLGRESVYDATPFVELYRKVPTHETQIGSLLSQRILHT